MPNHLTVKASMVTMLNEYFTCYMISVFLIKGLTLPGAMDGILFYIKPDFSTLLDPEVRPTNCYLHCYMSLYKIVTM